MAPLDGNTYQGGTNCPRDSWGTFLFFVVAVICIPTLYAECPSNVKIHAFKCFTGFNTQLLNMQKSRRTLFSGVDVEVLRAFCASYVYTEHCLRSLREKCPGDAHAEIDKTLINLVGARTELTELCNDDIIYEVYARHMTCFSLQGSYSEKCFENIMNTTIRLMKRIQEKSLDDLCSDLNKVLQCIKINIDRSCGPEAASLVHVLVKPMVRRSTKCDRFLYTTSTPQERTTEMSIEVNNDQVIYPDHVIKVRHYEETYSDRNSGCIHLNSVIQLFICTLITLLSQYRL